MIKFILNNQTIETDLPKGTTVLDFVRYHKNLKGTKIGCREGDCGACTILVGALEDDSVNYRSQTSCLMPVANAEGKHIVTVEGINKAGDELTAVQTAMVEMSGTQCGFCTVGFVMSLTGFCVDETAKTSEMAVSSIDGNICRCTGYKSIERAAESIRCQMSDVRCQQDALKIAIEKNIVPEYFSDIKEKLENLKSEISDSDNRKSQITNRKFFVGGGTDLYVQRHDEMVYAPAENLFDASDLRRIEENGEFIEVGASVTVTDLLVSPIFQRVFPTLYKHLKLISSTPIRNMATLAGNFVNASPIGDMTAWFLALDASIVLSGKRELPLREFYLGYKKLAKTDDEFITKIRFRKDFNHFNFEKVSKRTYLDISSVTSAISLKIGRTDDLSVAPALAGAPNTESNAPANAGATDRADVNKIVLEAHVSAGGVAPIPLYLEKTSEFLRGKEIKEETISEAIEILQSEISPISDVRGSETYKRLLLQQLFTAHFVELFSYQPNLI